MKKNYIIVFLIGLLMILGLRGRDYYHFETEKSGYTEEYKNADKKEYQGLIASIGDLELKRGSYILIITYQNDGSQNYFEVVDNHHSDGMQIDEAVLYSAVYESGEHESQYILELEDDTNNVVINSYQKNGKLKISGYVLKSVKPYYSDTIFLMFLWCALSGLVWFRRKWMGSKEAKPILLIVIVSILVSLPLFTDFIATGHDIVYHMIRVRGIGEALQSGQQFPVRINMSFNNGYGLLNPIMYPELFLYIPGSLCALGVSLMMAIKFFLILINIVTGVLSYLSVKTIANKKIAVAFSIIYLLAPYRLCNLYVRFALGEFIAMAFLPVLFVGIYHIILGNTDRWWMAAIGCTGVLESHLLSTELSAFFAVFIVLLNLGKFITSMDRICASIKAVVSAVLLNLWYLIPLIGFIRSDFVLTGDLRYLGENGVYLYQLLNPRFSAADDKVLGTTSGDMSLAIGIVYAIGVVLFIYWMRQKKTGEESIEKICKQTLILGGIALYMASWIFPWNIVYKSDVLAKLFGIVQFSWRFLAYATLFLTFATAYILIWSYEQKDLWFKVMMVCMIITAVCVLDGYTSEVPTLLENKYTKLSDSGEYNYFYKSDYDTSVFWERNRTITSNVEIAVSDYVQKGTNTDFDYAVECPDGVDVYTITLPYYNYGLYQVTLNGQLMNIHSNDEELVSIDVPADITEGHIELRYVTRKLYKAADIVSLLTCIIFAGYGIVSICKRKKVTTCF